MEKFSRYPTPAMSISKKTKASPQKRAHIPTRILFKNVWCFLGLGFGSGLAPKAPGTFGTLAGIPLYLLASAMHVEYYIALTFVLFLIGIPICSNTEKGIGIQDHSGIVWDEVVGLLITMTFLPPTWAGIAIGFASFRFFDVIKPWPIRWFDRRVHGGFGIMLDDAIAGIMACAITNFGVSHLPSWNQLAI